MIDGIDIIEGLHARGALIKVLDKPHLDLTSTIAAIDDASSRAPLMSRRGRAERGGSRPFGLYCLGDANGDRT
jgi:hypothetical protein